MQLLGCRGESAWMRGEGRMSLRSTAPMRKKEWRRRKFPRKASLSKRQRQQMKRSRKISLMSRGAQCQMM